MKLVPIGQIPRVEQPARFRYGHVYAMIVKAINENSALFLTEEDLKPFSDKPLKAMLSAARVWCHWRGIKLTARWKPEGVYLFPVWIGKYAKNQEEMEWLKLGRKAKKRVQEICKKLPEASTSPVEESGPDMILPALCRP